MALIYNATFDSQTRVLSLLDKAGNVISSCEVPSKDVDDITKPLTLTATADNSSVMLNKDGKISNYYEVNTGSGWQPYTFGTVINLNSGESCKWRCKTHPTTQSSGSHVQFVMTGTIEASGNCNSMLSSDFKNITSLSGYDYAFMMLFYKCTSLVQAPTLPATTLAIGCYESMFYGCESLVQVPELPATTLDGFCYRYMLWNCPKLKEVRIAATTTATSALSNWLKGVSATGDFYCDPNATIFPSGVSGIPVGWNRFVLGAEDTGTTTTMYHNGSPEIVKVGTSSYGDCYALQGWVGFKSLSEMHALGYTFGAQTPLTMYSCDSPVSVYSCDANVDDGFTETMYDVGNGTGYLTIAQQNAKGYYLTATPYTGLTLTATADNSSVVLKKKGKIFNKFEVNTGSGWQSYAFGTVIPLNAGESCKWRCSEHTATQSNSEYVQFDLRGTIEASGNCNSMLSSDFENLTSLSGYDYAFYQMFNGLTALTKVPELPATTLAGFCYKWMFAECWALTKAPTLPATTLAESCYYEMFSGCQSLNEVRISATTTATNALFNWLSGVSPTGDFYCDPNATIFPTDSVSGIPSGWRRLNINEGAPTVDDPNKPLMLRAIEDNSSVTLKKNGTLSNTYQTSTNGTDWTDYTLGTKISLNNGESVYFRRRNNVMNQSEKNYVQFVMEGKIEAWHNAYSMIKSSFTNTGHSVGRFGMCRLFKDCKSLTKAPLLVNTVLEENSYFAMFSGCTSLAKAPALPATTLRDYCYSYMFDNCTSLTQAPELPATALAEDCYKCMFMGCTSLTKAPSLPATTLVKRCYEFMFNNCTSLTQAPELPATALINYCYSHMFEGCTSLTKAPVLPATSLADYCYYGLFVGCNSLKEVRIYATNWATGALDEWLSGVSATGDFYCDPNATIFPSGRSGIPVNWRRLNINDYPVTP